MRWQAQHKVKQAIANAGQLMHVQVAVDVIGVPSGFLNEELILRRSGKSYFLAINAARESTAKKMGKRRLRIGRRRCRERQALIREAKMKTDIDA